MKNLVLNIGLSLLLFFGAVSCNIKEDISNCPGSIILDYSAYSSEILDDIGADEQIKVFIFDPEGICVDIYSFTYGSLQETGLEFEVPIAYSDHNVVVWQGLESADYTSNRMVVGESYENFYLRLVYDTSTLSFNQVPDPLWASAYEPIEFCAKITRHRIYMTRLHTQVNVSVQQKMTDGSLVSLTTDDFHIAINACNNVYHTDYSIDEGSVALEYNDDEQYDSPAATLSLTDEIAEAGTLRITPTMECTLSVEGVDGSDISIGGSTMLDLVSYMLATKSDDSISDQRFLDLNKVWDLNLIIVESSEPSDPTVKNGYVALSIEINGWVMWFSSSELS